MIKRMVKPDALRVDGAKPKARQDKPQRAKGGRVGKTTVNVIVAGKDKMPGVPDAPMMPPMPAPATAPPLPPMPPPMPMPRGGPPPIPGLGPRASGGRAYAKGGAVKPGPAWVEGLKEGTKVSHAPGKNDLKDIGRGKPITYASGGKVPRGSVPPLRILDSNHLNRLINNAEGDDDLEAIRRQATRQGLAVDNMPGLRRKAGGPVEAPKGRKGMAPKLPGGGRGGLARLAKAARA